MRETVVQASEPAFTWIDVTHPAPDELVSIAREYEIPAVVGTSVATDRIRTGDRIRITQCKVTGEDGKERTEGLVEVLETAASPNGSAGAPAVGID